MSTVKNKEVSKTKKINSIIKFNIMAIILIAIFCIALTPVTLQNDTFYTIKIGEHIVKDGIDMQDPFSWHENLAYTYPHWAYDVITYFIYNSFGMTGIYVTTCILSAILGISIYLVNTKLAKNQILSFLITIGVMYLIRGYIAARAQLVTFILFILTIFFIEKFLESKKKRYAIGLIIIPILIANLHLAVFPFYFVLYLPYIAQYIIACFAETIIYRKTTVRQLKNKIKKLSKMENQEEKLSEAKKELKELEEKIDKIKIKRSKELQNPYKIKLNRNDNVKWLILIMIICLFTGLLTPLGTTPYTYLVKTMQGNTTQNINEHLPMTITNETEVICTLILFLAMLIFTKVKIRLSDLFMLGGLCYLMLASRRQITMFALVCSLIFNRLIMDLISQYTKIKLEDIMKKITSAIGIISISIIMLGFSYYMAKDKINDSYIDESTYPVQACDYILNNIDLGQARFYNEYNYGSYMLYRGIPVFIDSRADLYAPEFNPGVEVFNDYINLSNVDIDNVEEKLDKYGITHMLMYKKSKLRKFVEQNTEKYNLLYEDDNFCLFERKQVKESV